MLCSEQVIIVADDDPDDVLLIKDALREVHFSGNVVAAGNGIELIGHLLNDTPSPSFILLDLNMPVKDGRETLKELKSHPKWKSIPIVVHTTSDSPKDILFCYTHGVNSYVCKGSSYSELRKNMEGIVSYWFDISRLPC